MRAVRCPSSRPTLSLSASLSSQSTRLRRVWSTPASGSASPAQYTAWRRLPSRGFTTTSTVASTSPRPPRYDGPPPDFSPEDAVDVAIEGSIEGFEQLNPWPRTEGEEPEEEEDELRDDERRRAEEQSLPQLQQVEQQQQQQQQQQQEQGQEQDQQQQRRGWWPSVKTVQPGDLAGDDETAARMLVQRFERLIVYRLALQMLLQVQLGGRPRYRDVHDMSNIHNNKKRGWFKGFNGHNISTIMQRLQEVTNELDTMRDVPMRRLQWGIGNNGLHRTHAAPEIVRLNNQLFHLMEQYKTRELDVSGVVDRFAFIIMDSGATPDNRTYTQMIQLFGQINREDLIYLVLSALYDSALSLDVYTVHAVLWSYASTRDVRMFDAFLSELTRTNGRVISPWEWRRINGTLVPVPATFSSVTTLRLIAVALSCDQPDRAEAWATLMAEERPLSVRRLTMMKNFLRYYIYQQNWERGKLWIAEIIAYISHWDQLRLGPKVKSPEDEVRLAILRMLHLAYTCWKLEVYDAILAAVAVNHVIEPPCLPLHFYSRAAKHVYHEWQATYQQHRQEQQKKKEKENGKDLAPFNERIKAFAAELAPLAKELSSSSSSSTKTATYTPSSPFVFITATATATPAPAPAPAPAQAPALTQAQARIQSLEAQLSAAQQAIRTAEQEREHWLRDREIMREMAARYESQMERLLHRLDSLTSAAAKPATTSGPSTSRTNTQATADNTTTATATAANATATTIKPV